MPANEPSPVETIGASPKKIAATITAFVVPYIVAALARTLGWQVDVDATAAIVGPLVFAAVVYVAAHIAKPGLITAPPDFPDAFAGPNPPAKLAEANPDAGVHTPKPRTTRKT